MLLPSITALALAMILTPTAAQDPPALEANRTFKCTNEKTKGYNCPAKGRLTQPMVIGFESNIATLNACRDICLSYDECITFKWVVSGGQCTQYSTTLPKMGLVFDDSAIGDMYNRNCFVCDAGTPVSTSSSMAASSTSSSAAQSPSSRASSSSLTSTSSSASPSTSAQTSSSRVTSSSVASTSMSIPTSASPAPTLTATSSTIGSTTIVISASTQTTAPYDVTLVTQTICPPPTDAHSSSIVARTPEVSSAITTSQASAEFSPAPSPCANRGLTWAQYPSDAGDNTDATYSSFDPVSFKGRTPQCSGATTTIAGFNAPSTRNGAFSVYGSSCTFNSEYFALTHVGYFYAPRTGTYTITIEDVDDAVFLWVGGRDGKAFSGWNRENADAIPDVNSNGGDSMTQVTAVAGSYTPIRIMYAQGQGWGGFSIAIRDPAGLELLASGQDSSMYVVQYGCGTDATAAPQFPPFGMES